MLEWVSLSPPRGAIHLAPTKAVVGFPIPPQGHDTSGSYEGGGSAVRLSALGQLKRAQVRYGDAGYDAGKRADDQRPGLLVDDADASLMGSMPVVREAALQPGAPL